MQIAFPQNTCDFQSLPGGAHLVSLCSCGLYDQFIDTGQGFIFSLIVSSNVFYLTLIHLMDTVTLINFNIR